MVNITAGTNPATAAPIVADHLCAHNTSSCVQNFGSSGFKYDITFKQIIDDGRIDIFGNLCDAGSECL
jgi:hypothetical protein